MDTEKLNLALERAEAKRLIKGEVLYTDQSASESVYLLLAGSVQLFVSDGGAKRYVLQTLVAGDLLGMDSYIDAGMRGNSCIADEDTLLLEFHRADLAGLFDSADGLPRCEKVRSKIMCYLVSLLRRVTTLARNLALLDVYGRVRILINQMLIEQDGVMILRKQLTQQEIADQIGSSREMVARILKELVYGRYICMDNRRIVVLKPLPENF
nr:Crp/Fnr family transcriptional regulator [Chromobacterium sp. ASV5]